jgi:hypothetical protein
MKSLIIATLLGVLNVVMVILYFVESELAALGWIVFYLIGAMVSYGFCKGTFCKVRLQHGFGPRTLRQEKVLMVIESKSCFAFVMSWLGILTTIFVPEGPLGFCFHVPKSV